jgi:hypothetical protein
MRKPAGVAPPQASLSDTKNTKTAKRTKGAKSGTQDLLVSFASFVFLV